MKGRHVRDTHRRQFLRGSAAITGAALLTGSGGLIGALPAFAQDPPSHCPTPPSGGTHFVPGQDKRPVVLRKSIDALSSSDVTKLKTAFTKLRALPSTDKRSWIMQADLHALYCQQCDNDSTQIHQCWNFLPWHRAYLYYYERILGSLAGDIDHFRLPYWDWENQRKLPATYRTPSASSNSLWDDKRNAGLAGGGNLPTNDGSSARLTTLYGITDFATFGGTATGGPSPTGACELNPHNIVHNDTGKAAPVYLDMGDLGFAARDPIFFGHHGNIDKVWSHWNSLAGGAGLPANAYKNPADAGFLDARWSFYDENQNTVSISAADVLNHVDNLRYTYAQLKLRIPYYVAYECQLIIGPDPELGVALRVEEAARTNVLASVRQKGPVTLVLQGVRVPAEIAGNFDFVAVRGQRRVTLGSIGLMRESTHRMPRAPLTVVLDATAAAADLLAASNPARIRVVARDGSKPFALEAAKAELRVPRR